MQLLSFLTYTFELLPFILCTIFLKKILSTIDGKAFFIYILVYGIFILSVLYARYLIENLAITSILRRLALLFEFTLLCNYYNHILLNKKFKYLFLPAIIFFIFFSFYDYHISTERQNSFLPLVIQCLFFILIIIYSFYEKIQYNLSTPIYLSMDFWVSTGLLLYFSGNFFLFLYSKTAIKNELFKFQYNLVYDFFTIIKDILLCVSVFLNYHNIPNNSNLIIRSDVDDSLDYFTTSKNQANL